MGQRILIVGNGAREHALAWKIKQHHGASRELFLAPGNGGVKDVGRTVAIHYTDIHGLATFASDNRIDLTIVGHEEPLSLGIADLFAEKRLPLFGHTQKAALLESDKGEAVLFMERHKIPHPSSKIFSDFNKATTFISSSPWKEFVIKAAGLAAGKGVILPNTKKEACDAIKSMMVDKVFKKAGEKIVIQERLYGREASVIGFVSNEIGFLVPAQDYKRIFDQDKGPNTGGMGAYAPNSYLTAEIVRTIEQKIVKPTVEGMKEEGRPLMGALYVGIMLTQDGPYVIEYNLRFGDPETQVQMRLLESDPLELMYACINGTLRSQDVRSSNRVAVGVVLASKGYPGEYEVGKKITGIDTTLPHDVVIFHSGTKKTRKGIVTDGGRVMTLTAVGRTQKDARNKIYPLLDQSIVTFEGVQYRKEIAI